MDPMLVAVVPGRLQRSGGGAVPHRQTTTTHPRDTSPDFAGFEARTDVQGATDRVSGMTAAVAGGLDEFVADAWGCPELATCAVGLVALVAIAGFGA